MSINISVPKDRELKPRITVVGVGGAGGNAVSNMIRSSLEGVEFVVANTDAQALAQTLADRRIQLGQRVTQGLGAGARPDVGRAAAEEAIEEIMEHLVGSNMVFIAAGMGGGTGSGAAPVIARAARERDILTVGVVTKPFHFEGQHRMRIAEGAIEELSQYVDTLIIIPNQNLFRIANEKTTFADAFKMADDVLHMGVRGVTDLMIMPGLINLDFADIRTVMGEMGKAMMGTGEAEGERRAIDAAEKAIANPLLEDSSMKGAKGVLINITGGMDMTLFEVDEAANRIREEVDSEANIIFGSTFDEAMKGRMRVSVVSTGIASEAASQKPPRPQLAVVARAAQPTRPSAAPTPSAGTMSAYAAPMVHGTSALAAQPLTMSMPTAQAPAAPAVQIQTAPAAVAQAAPAPQPILAEAQPAPIVSADPVLELTVPEPVAPEPMIEAKSIEVRAEPAPAPATRPMVARAEPIIQADPFAAAAIANGARERPRESLFARITGLGRGRQIEAQPAHEAPATAGAPSAQVAAPPARPAVAIREPVRTQPQQTKLGNLDPADRLKPAHDDDLLEIPAFLRRQAN
ncbi:MAG: cell division protein FtsZ [Alphaproteobacteria bacterium]|nr:cell division protein FtsZ [Alphaproteobacteria bacterium]